MGPEAHQADRETRPEGEAMTVRAGRPPAAFINEARVALALLPLEDRLAFQREANGPELDQHLAAEAEGRTKLAGAGLHPTIPAGALRVEAWARCLLWGVSQCTAICGHVSPERVAALALGVVGCAECVAAFAERFDCSGLRSCTVCGFGEHPLAPMTTALAGGLYVTSPACGSCASFATSQEPLE